MKPKIYAKNRIALMLRWTNMLYEIGQQLGTNILIFIPANTPVSIFGLKGLKELIGEKGKEAKKEG